MAAADTTAVMLQILQDMQEQRRADRKATDERAQKLEEQRLADLKSMEEQRIAAEKRAQKLEEQRIAAEGRSRRDLQRMLQELRTGRTSAATTTSADRFPSLKIDFKEFSGETEDWNSWSRVHQAQPSALE